MLGKKSSYLPKILMTFSWTLQVINCSIFILSDYSSPQLSFLNIQILPVYHLLNDLLYFHSN
jgi:hypothetical protein